MQPITRLILYVLLLLCAAPADAQVVAGFNATPLSGCAPLVVAFTNTTVPSTGTTYVWNMGNGSGPIALTDPGTTYLSAGTYTVTLTATNGSAVSSYSRVITVYPTPVISFNAGDTQICPGEPVSFTSSVVPGVPGPVTYLWSSGDGYTGAGPSYTHPYLLPGYFNVSLNVTNAQGCAALVTRPAYVHVLTPPDALFAASTRRICDHSGSVTFASTSVGVTPFTYRWSFGDGTPISTLASPAHFYASPGSYTVKLVVTDARGCKDSLSVPNYITVANLTAAFTGLDSACINTSVTFTNTSIAHIPSRSKWNYGDGTTDTFIHGSHAYDAKGVYTVRLIVADSFCFDTAYKTFIVPNPALNYTISPAKPCPAPVFATFTASVPPGSTVTWDFGDSTSGAGNPATHTYTQDNVYPFDPYPTAMIVTNAIGCTDTVKKGYLIYPLLYALEQPLFFDKGGCIPHTHTFAIAPNPYYPPYPHGPVWYIWSFGDGSPVDSSLSVGYTPSHTYTAVGVYPISLTVKTGNGCTQVLHDTVYAGTPSMATFTADPRRMCFNNNEITFTRTLDTPYMANAYYWLFGDGSHGYPYYDTVSARVRDVVYHFEIPGIFDDTLITFNNFCPYTFIREDYIIIDSPMSFCKPRVLCGSTSTAEFVNLSIGDDTHLWLFGDGTSSTLDSVVHTFPAATIYTNLLITHNFASGCWDTMAVTVDFGKPVVTFAANDTTICKGDTVIFSTTTVSGKVLSFLWLSTGDHDDSLTDGDSEHFVDSFVANGRYTVRLVVYDKHNCPDTLTKTNYILVSKPDARFRPSVVTGCAPLSTVFTDSSLAFTGTSVTSRAWAFGNGYSTTTMAPSVTHTYTAQGTYAVVETVTDNIGCTDTAIRTVSAYKPDAAFITSSLFSCPGGIVSFTNTSTPVSSYFWTFGDGYVATIPNPPHSYADTGHYTVRLIITDSHGCKDTVNKPNHIAVTKPHASFYMDDSISICPPLVVHFFNTSTGATSSRWDFGNGNTSLATNPTNVYTAPGYDTVLLVSIDINGCKDTAAGHVKVFGYAGAFAYSSDSGCVPFPVFFDADLSNIGLAASITWDFSDGIVHVGLSDTITHAYAVPGAFVPKLIISDDSGCVSSSMGLDTIKVDQMTAGFTAMPNPLCLGDTMRLTDTSFGYWSGISGRVWSYNGTTTTVLSPAVTYTAAGTYIDSLRVTGSWGCTAVATKIVTVYVLPAVVPDVDSLICVGETIQLSDSFAGGVWTSGAPGVAAVGSTGIVYGIGAGNAVITYATGPNCYATYIVTVNSFPYPGVITGDSDLCVGATVVLVDTVADGVWSTSNGHASINSTGVVTGISPGADTVFYTVTNVICPDTAMRAVWVFPLPDAGAITGSGRVCRDALITLSDTLAAGWWSSSDTTVAVIDSIAGIVQGVGLGTATITYTTVPDINGCINFITFPFSVINTDFTLSGNVTPVRCYGGADGSIAVTVNGGTPPFRFMWSTGDSVSSTIATLDTGMYAVSVLDTNTKCLSADSFFVTAPDSLHVVSEVKNDMCQRSKGSISVSASGGTAPYSFAWFDNSTSKDINGLKAGKYNFSITDLNGCLTNVTLNVGDSACPDIIIYNGVSPNGDGINDTWIIDGIQHYPDSDVKVFDKWGDLIFERTGYNNDWNGTWKKGSVPDGTYYYLVKLNDSNAPRGNEAFTGTLLIKR